MEAMLYSTVCGVWFDVNAARWLCSAVQLRALNPVLQPAGCCTKPTSTNKHCVEVAEHAYNGTIVVLPYVLLEPLAGVRAMSVSVGVGVEKRERPMTVEGTSDSN